MIIRFIKQIFLIINFLLKTCYNLISLIKFDNRSNLIFIELKNVTKIIPFITFLKFHSRTLFTNLIDITAVDYLGFSQPKGNCTGRFCIVYILLSHYFRSRIVVLCRLRKNDDVNSISNLFNGAIWLEREIWDMFGIFFKDHPDLRRILTDYGFEGFPLRKDFPITGYFEVRYDDTQKCLVYEPLELSQELRIFDTLSPWATFSA